MGSESFDSEAFLLRLTNFGKRCQELVVTFPRNQSNVVYGSQLIRSSSSPAANYIEALEALGKKDFVMKLRITRKETRESVYWLDMISSANQGSNSIPCECESLIKEGKEIVKILTSSIITLEKKNL
jgi:four helix bundle protein